MNIIAKIKQFFLRRKRQKEYIKEIEEDFLINKYKLINILDLLGEYKRGGNPFTILKRMSDLF